MRLVAYACRHPELPLRQCLLPLNELTVLLGPNDSGKSTVLRAVERDLRGGHYATCHEEQARKIGGVFYARLSGNEFAQVADEATAARARSETSEHGPWSGARPPWDEGLWHVARKTARDLTMADAVSWRDALADELHGDTRARTEILEALRISDLVAFEPAGFSSHGRRVWNVYWCLPPLNELPANVGAALKASSLTVFRRAREHSQGGKWYTRGLYAGVYGSPDHLSIDGAPVAVVALGQVDRFPLPTGLAVPSSFAPIEEALVRAVSRLSEMARYGLEDVRRDGDSLGAEEESARAAPGGWLEEDNGSYFIHPDVRAASHFLRRAANKLLPGFLADRYEVIVDVQEPPAWASAGALRIVLRPVGSDGRRDFELDGVADGFRLWLQLALLEAAEQAERARGLLAELAGDWWGQAQYANDATASGDPDAAELSKLADEHEREFYDVVGTLRSLSEQEWVSGPLGARLAVRAAPGRAARDRRLFIVDEPERHLHPSSQREAARWLSRTADERAAPALLATHGTAFLGLPASQGLTYVYCTRPGADTRLSTITLAEVEDLDSVSAEMGFDRGELLSTVALFLVVEGRHDAEVLVRAFRGDLADAHIAVVPMEGASQHAAVLDSQALWRYTTAKVAVMTDKFTPARFQQLMGDDASLRRLRRSDAPEETKALAKLMGNARHQGKTIHLLGHAGDDLLDVLDEDVVQSTYRDYPGHAEARSSWIAEQQKNGWPASRKKSFYEQHFKIPNDVRTYQVLGDALAAQGRRPAALAAVVQRAVELALASD